ncbi:hypothetical protein A9Q81_11430 [Gammaproteobacteria bacterium 42_54_T18]|nr:hypothetical protein A9Q81_11430 [Gammaproteobacteria bacterium 42_54_T18]
MDDIGNIRELWVSLELEAKPTFFTSWCWVSSWLRIIGPDVFVCKVYSHGNLVALGLFVKASLTRHKILNVEQLRLQSVGDEKKDQIWPEYNNMLVAKEFEREVYRGLIHFLSQETEISWDELLLGPIDKRILELISTDQCKPVERWNAPSYGVDLAKIKLSGQCYLDTLSKNTRSQIRRAIRKYGQGLTLRVAQDKSQALLYFEKIAPLHLQRWKVDSGFNNQYFIRFHQDLIERCFDEGVVELVELNVDGMGIGYLYNFIYNNNVYFYLSGIDLEVDIKQKPGLVLHALCIQRHLDRGAKLYDFLGGEARYKKNLGKQMDELFVISFQKPILKLRMEQMARGLKHYFEHNKLGNEV